MHWCAQWIFNLMAFNQSAAAINCQSVLFLLFRSFLFDELCAPITIMFLFSSQSTHLSNQLIRIGIYTHVIDVLNGFLRYKNKTKKNNFVTYHLLSHSIELKRPIEIEFLTKSTQRRRSTQLCGKMCWTLTLAVMLHSELSNRNTEMGLQLDLTASKKYTHTTASQLVTNRRSRRWLMKMNFYFIISVIIWIQCNHSWIIVQFFLLFFLSRIMIISSHERKLLWSEWKMGNINFLGHFFPRFFYRTSESDKTKTQKYHK